MFTLTLAADWGDLIIGAIVLIVWIVGAAAGAIKQMKDKSQPQPMQRPAEDAELEEVEGDFVRRESARERLDKVAEDRRRQLETRAAERRRQLEEMARRREGPQTITPPPTAQAPPEAPTGGRSRMKEFAEAMRRKAEEAMREQAAERERQIEAQRRRAHEQRRAEQRRRRAQEAAAQQAAAESARQAAARSQAPSRRMEVSASDVGHEGEVHRHVADATIDAQAAAPIPILSIPALSGPVRVRDAIILREIFDKPVGLRDQPDLPW